MVVKYIIVNTIVGCIEPYFENNKKNTCNKNVLNLKKYKKIQYFYFHFSFDFRLYSCKLIA